MIIHKRSAANLNSSEAKVEMNSHENNNIVLASKVVSSQGSQEYSNNQETNDAADGKNSITATVNYPPGLQQTMTIKRYGTIHRMPFGARAHSGQV